ncbi:YncE family protein [Streptomyces roseifaciens]|uniref:YncE family protein n=1 Tax=Streptomyces roseifaciens TaxID=1488406 RepID=UPI000718230F|nr:YncE family protein [Streptomyces roseifaciens]
MSGTEQRGGSGTGRGIAGEPRLLAVDWAADRLAVVGLGTPGSPEPPHIVGVGSNPRAVATGADGTRAYVADHGLGMLSVVDLTGEAPVVLRTEPTGPGPASVVAGLARDRVCVANDSGGVVVFEADGERVAALAVGKGPCTLAVVPSGERVCAVDVTGGTASVIGVAGPAEPSVTGTVPVSGATGAVAVSADGAFAYVASRKDATAGAVTIYDLVQGAEVPEGSPVAVGAEPRAIAVSPAGDRICVAAYGSASVAIAELDRESGRMGSVVTVPTGPHPVAVAFTPDGRLIHVVSQTTGKVTAIRLDALEQGQGQRQQPETAELEVATVPSGVVFGPGGHYAYVTDQATGRLVTVRAAPYKAGEVGTGAGSKPVGVAVSPDGRWAYAADTASDKLAVLDLEHLALGTPVGLGDGHKPWDAAVAPNRTFACATSPDSDHLLLLTPAAGDTLESGEGPRVTPVALAPGSRPHGVAVTPDSRYAVTADHGTATVSLVDPNGGEQTIGAEILGCDHPDGVALSRDGRTMYVADFVEPPQNQFGGKIAILRRNVLGQWERTTVIDAQTGRLSGAHEMALSPDERLLYVANYANETVSVLGRASDDDPWTLRRTITKSQSLTHPYGLALSPSGDTLYVSNDFNMEGAVEVFDVADGRADFKERIVIKRNQPHVHLGLALSPDGRFLYAADKEFRKESPTATGTVYGVPLDGDKVPVVLARASEHGTDMPCGLVCRDDRTLCVVNQGEKEAISRSACLAVLTLDESRLAVHESKTVPLDKDVLPYSPAVSDDGTLCIANFDGPTVTVFGSMVTPVPVGVPAGSQPWDVAVTQDGAYAYATDRRADAVRCVRLADRDVSTLPVGDDPMGVASGPGGVRAYVANRGGNSITVLDRTAERVGTPVPLAEAEGARAVALDPRAPYAYIVRDNSLDAVALDGGPAGPALSTGASLCAVAVHPDGTYAYAVDAGGPVPEVRVVDLSTAGRPARAAADPVQLTGGARPTGTALHPAQPWGYVSGSKEGDHDRAPGTLWVLDTSQPDRLSVTGTVQLPLPAVEGVAVHPGATGHAYLVTRSGDDRRLHVLHVTGDPARPVLLPGPGLLLPPGARNITVHPQGGYAFVGGDGGGIHVLETGDPARPRLAGSTPELGARPGAAFRPDGRSALCLTADGLAGITLGPPRVTHTWHIVAPQTVAVSADGMRLFVTSENSGTLSILETGTGALRFTVPAGAGLAALALHSTEPRVYVADESGAAVAVVDTTELAKAGTTELGIDTRQALLGPGGAA